MSKLETSLLFFYTETSLHAGSGAGVGAIDLPLQRERMSDLPQVQGSGVKGALRELFRAPDKDADKLADEVELFGPRPPDPDKLTASDERSKDSKQARAHEHAGALAVTDARLLLLPVRSARGGWAWITSPLILQRLARDRACTSAQPSADLPAWARLSVEPNEALIARPDAVINGDKKHLIIEDAAYETRVEPALVELASFIEAGLPVGEVYEPVRKRLVSQLAVLNDDEMFYWARHATEVVTRVRINPETGTVAQGALWTEEALPSESLLWSTVMISKGRGGKMRDATKLDQIFSNGIGKHGRIFLGGDRTIGRGLVALGRSGAN